MTPLHTSTKTCLQGHPSIPMTKQIYDSSYFHPYTWPWPPCSSRAIHYNFQQLSARKLFFLLTWILTPPRSCPWGYRKLGHASSTWQSFRFLKTFIRLTWAFPLQTNIPFHHSALHVTNFQSFHHPDCCPLKASRTQHCPKSKTHTKTGEISHLPWSLPYF